MNHSAPLCVLHSREPWLKVTEKWIYDQLCFLPDSVRPCVVCEHTENLDAYRTAHMYCRSDTPAWCYLGEHGFVRRRKAFLCWVARKQRATILHSHFAQQAWNNLPVVQRLDIPHVLSVYGWDVTQMPATEPVWQDRMPSLFASLNLVLCEGPHMAETVANLGCPGVKIRVHHLGTDVDAIPCKPRVWHKGEPLRVLMAASFKEKKGFPYGILALGKLRQRTPLELTIIGDTIAGTPDNGEKRRILEAINEAGLGNHVRMLGYQPNTVFHSEAAAHHVFLAPSVTASDGDTEGGAPVAITELAASGMPIVSTRHCDIPNIIEDGAGLLAEERDVDGLTEKLTWLVEHPREWGPMIAAARHRIEKDFNARVQGQRLADIYRELLSPR